MQEGDQEIIELVQYCEQGILTPNQIQILIHRAKGLRYKDLATTFGITKLSLIHCIVRTSHGRIWNFDHKGGHQTYLSDVDIPTFKSLIEEGADDLNCVPTAVAVSIAYSLKKRRTAKAKCILQRLRCHKLISHLDSQTYPPSKSWLKQFCNSIGINVVNSQTIEAIRRSYCDFNGILSFFSEHHILLDRHPALILNMDETMLNGKKRFKVLCTNGKLPLSPSLSLPHITGVVTICAYGKCFDPMFILPAKKKLKELDELNCFITSSPSGWMTKRLFLIYSIFLISQIQLYRLSLPKELADEPILLVADGHISRMSFYSNLLFHLFNIDLLILPAHSTHIMQPFDVSLAAPLKVEFIKQLKKYQFIIDIDNLSLKECIKMSAAQGRFILIRSFLEALRIVSSYDNILSGFASTGIYPLDPTVPLNSRFLLSQALTPIKRNSMSNKFLNSEERESELHTQNIPTFGRLFPQFSTF